jgi:hypothetical protein
MKSQLRALCVLTATLAIFLGLISATLARGALGYDHDVCVLKIGPDFMYFTGYQPAAPRKKFCEDVPSAGQTIIVLDYAQSEMREMKTDLRIVLDTAGPQDAASIEANTVAYLPPKVYPNGTLNFEHLFRETGNYVGIVSVEGAHGEHWVARFPFSVGTSYTSQIPYYLIALAAALGLALVVVNQRQIGALGTKRR